VKKMKTKEIDCERLRTELERFRDELKTRPRRPTTVKQALEDYRGLVSELRDLGSSWDQIADRMRAAGVVVSAQTLARYVGRKRQPKAARAANGIKTKSALPPKLEGAIDGAPTSNALVFLTQQAGP
jgi:hypothetical protein